MNKMILKDLRLIGSRLAVIAAAVMLAGLMLTGCGEKVRADDTLVGNYTAKYGEMSGISVPMDDFGKFEMELKEKGKGSMTVDDESESIKWQNDDNTVTIKVEGEELTGKLDKEAIIIEDMLGMGVTMTFVKDGSTYEPAGKDDGEDKDTEEEGSEEASAEDKSEDESAGEGSGEDVDDDKASDEDGPAGDDTADSKEGPNVSDIDDAEDGMTGEKEYEELGSLDDLVTSFYGVWVNAGNDYEALYTEADALIAKGYKDCLVVATSDFDGLGRSVSYALSCGMFDNEKDAKDRLDEIKKAGYKDAYVKHTGSYVADSFYYVVTSMIEPEIDEDNGEIWFKNVEVQFPYMTGYETEGSTVKMTLYVDKDTVFDPNAQGFTNHKNGEKPYDWIVKNYEAAKKDPDDYEATTALMGVFEVSINGNHIDRYIASYWWD